MATKKSKLSTNDYKGNRVQRGLFKDKKTNKTIHADTNGSRNICCLGKLGKTKAMISNLKLCNPVKLKSDREFVSFLANN